jgi:hypothetical protein
MGEKPNDRDSFDDRAPQDSSERERHDSLRQYLLGELSDEGQEQVERRMLSQDDYFEELLIAEEELTDDFVGYRLPEPERAKFSRRFLSVPELRHDVRFAKALHMRATYNASHRAPTAQDDQPPPFLARLAAFFRQPTVSFSLVAAVLLAILAAVWMATQNYRLRTQVEQLQARAAPPTPTPQTGLEQQLASERERSEMLTAQLHREQEQRAEVERSLEEARRRQAQQPPRSQGPVTVATAVFTLTPGLVRDTGTGFQKIRLSAGNGRILLRLDLPSDDYRTYRATLKTLEDRELLTASGLRALAGGGSKAVPFTLPAARLTPGNDYHVLLSGKAPTGEYDEVSSYYFRVVRLP